MDKLDLMACPVMRVQDVMERFALARYAPLWGLRVHECRYIPGERRIKLVLELREPYKTVGFNLEVGA